MAARQFNPLTQTKGVIILNTESDHDPVRLAADNAEDFLDTLIDNLRAKIANGTPLRPNSWAR